MTYFIGDTHLHGEPGTPGYLRYAQMLRKHINIAQRAPRHLSIYEQKRDPTIDCMTAVFTRASDFTHSAEWNGRVYYVGADRSGMSFYQHGEAARGEFRAGGTKVAWADVEPTLRWKLLKEYAALWDIVFTATHDGFITSWRYRGEGEE